MSAKKFENNSKFNFYITVSLLGKSYKLIIKYYNLTSINLIKKDWEFILYLPKKYKNYDNRQIISKAIKKLYSEVAPKEIEDSLEMARYILKFAPEDYKIQRLTNSFYKSIDNKILIINPDIIQYSKEIINTTIIQEFCRMKFKSNTKKYKDTLKKALRDYEIYKNTNFLNRNYNVR